MTQPRPFSQTLSEHESGEKLNGHLVFVDKVKDKLGSSFVDKKLVLEAKKLRDKVRALPLLRLSPLPSLRSLSRLYTRMRGSLDLARPLAPSRALMYGRCAGTTRTENAPLCALVWGGRSECDGAVLGGEVPGLCASVLWPAVC